MFAREYFEKVLDRGRLAHAYLLWGDVTDAGVRFAIEFAKAIHCGSGRPCGECATCRAIEHDNYPAVNTFGLAEGKSKVDIDTVRQLCERLYVQSDRTKVAILSDADRLTEPAASALLKTLEEPPERSLLLLISRSTGTLLETIVSRCHRVPLTSSESREVEEGVDDEILGLVMQRGFFARNDPKEWLAALFPDGTHREKVRSLTNILLVRCHRELDTADETSLDRILRAMDVLCELAEAWDGNVHADLILERLLAELRQGARRYHEAAR